jgi:hypothetical protein
MATNRKLPYPLCPLTAPLTIMMSSLYRALTQDEIDAIKAGAIRMSLFGSITYSDTFGLFGKRTTGFCFTYTPLPTGASQFDTCPEPNYTYVN